MDPEKLKFFTSKLKIWDYANISSHEFQNLSFEDKSKILMNYYTEMSSRFVVNPGKNVLICSFFVLFLRLDNFFD